MPSIVMRTGIIVAAITLTFVGGGYFIVMSGLESLEISRERDRFDAETRLLAAMVEDSLEVAISGVRSLAASPVVREYGPWLEQSVAGGAPPAPPAVLEQFLVEHVLARRYYSQVRLMDAAGWERVRVNRRGDTIERVPAEGLQFKGERGYFFEAQGGLAGEIYTSRLELNRENGQLEVPHVPVIRAAMRLAGEAGGGGAIVVVNVDIREVLRRGIGYESYATDTALVEASAGTIWTSPEANFGGPVLDGAVNALQAFAPSTRVMDFLQRVNGGHLASLAQFQVPATAGAMTVGLLRVRDTTSILDALNQTKRLGGLVMVAMGACTVLACMLVMLRSNAPYRALAHRLRKDGAAIEPARLPRVYDRDGRRLVESISDVLTALQSDNQRLLEEVNEKKTLASARTENNELRGLVLDNLPVLVAMIDDHKHFYYANSLCETWFNRRSESAVGKHGCDVLDPASWALIEPLVDQALAGSVARMEAPVRHSLLDTERWLDIQCHPRNSAGRVSAVYLLAVDVNSLKEAEREAEENATQVEAVIEAAVDGIITIDRHGTVERVNGAALQMLGYHRDELLGHNLKMIMPDPYRSEHDGYLRRYSETGERRIIGATRELPVRRSDGSTFPIELSVSQVHREPEPFYLGILRDVSERVEAAKALRDSEERLALAIDGANDGLWDWHSIDKDLQWWSPRFYQLLGMEDGEVEASLSSFRTLLHPDDTERVVEAIHRQIESESSFDSEFRLKTKTAGYRWFRSRARIYRNDRDELQRVAGTLQDIHTRKLAEEARAEYEERLRSTVEELDRFAYIASHDLKAPLRAIDNLAKWIVEDTGEILPEKPRMYLEKMQGRIGRMERLLDDLLRYSRVGRVRGEVASVDLRSLAEDVCEMSDIPESFAVNIDLPEKPMRICVTPLKHVFQNLVSNAIKHHDKESGTVDIEGRLEGNVLHATVHDDGPGIPENLRDKAFALFQTLRPRDEVESTGLGLAIVKKLVAGAGGEISIDPHDGRGTTFRLIWPIEEVDE